MPRPLRTGAAAELADGPTPAESPIEVEEFAELDDGRVVVTTGRHGHCSIGLAFDAYAPEGHEDAPRDAPSPRETIEREVREAVLGWEDEPAEHRWARLRMALGEVGVDATREELDALPFELRLGERLLRRFPA